MGSSSRFNIERMQFQDRFGQWMSVSLTRGGRAIDLRSLDTQAKTELLNYATAQYAGKGKPFSVRLNPGKMQKLFNPKTISAIQVIANQQFMPTSATTGSTGNRRKGKEKQTSWQLRRRRPEHRREIRIKRQKEVDASRSRRARVVKPIGIQNSRHLCFANSVLQLVFRHRKEQLDRLIESCSGTKPSKALQALGALYAAYKSAEKQGGRVSSDKVDAFLKAAEIPIGKRKGGESPALYKRLLEILSDSGLDPDEDLNGRFTRDNAPKSLILTAHGDRNGNETLTANGVTYNLAGIQASSDRHNVAYVKEGSRWYKVDDQRVIQSKGQIDSDYSPQLLYYVRA